MHSVAGLGDGPARSPSGRSGRRTTRSRRRAWSAAARSPRPGRDHPRPPRRAVPRRAARVLARGARGAAPAARGAARSRSCAASGRRASRRACMLVAACNACPCGRRAATCALHATSRSARYARRLSGPLLDRIDLVCQVGRPPRARARRRTGPPARRSAAVRARVLAARERQARGSPARGALCNARDGRPLTRRASVRARRRRARRLLRAGTRALLSGRGHDRVLRVARTIADLAARDEVAADDLDEALGYRRRAVEPDGGVTRACDACLRARPPRRPARAADRGHARRAAPRGGAGLLALAEDDLAGRGGGSRRCARRSLERLRPRTLRVPRVDGGGLARRLPPRRGATRRGLARLRDPPGRALRHGRCRPPRAAERDAPRWRSSARGDASAYGLELARPLGRGLAAAGVTVVSGLALGIDAAAHRGCARRRAAAVAVLACGADVAYPRTQPRALRADRARAAWSSRRCRPAARRSAGAFRPATGSWRRSARHDRRRRGAERSGSLITADFAARPRARRRRRARAGSPRRWPRARNGLLRDGARVVPRRRGRARRALRRRARPSRRARARRPALDRGLQRGARRGRGGRGPRGDRRARRARRRAEVRAALARLEALGLVRPHGLGGYVRARRAERPCQRA